MARTYNLLLLTAIGPLLYAGGLWFAAARDRLPLLEASCFDAARPEHFAAPRLLASAVMAAGASILFCFAPWRLGSLAIAAHLPGRKATAYAWSLAGNTVVLVIVCFVLRQTVGISRGSFLAAWLLWTALLTFIACRPRVGPASGVPGTPGRERRPTRVESESTGGPALADPLRRCPGSCPTLQFLLAAATGVAAVAICLVLFHREVFVQCFNGDGTETDELARSLRQHLLPYWEIEPTGRFGTAVVNPLVTSSYWTLGFQLLLGDGELPTRLPYWIWWLGIYFAACRLVPTLRLLPLALVLVLAALWYTFYAGYDPYQGDIANPGVSDAMFTLWLLLGFDCLRLKDLAGWVACTVAAALLFYAGPVVFVLTVVAALIWQPVPRRDVLRASLVGGSILAAVLVAYLAWGLWEGTLSAWFASFQEEWLSKYFHPRPQDSVIAWFANMDNRWLAGFFHSQPQWLHSMILFLTCMTLFLGYFLLGCGGAPALGLIYLLRRGSPWQRTVAATILAYLAIILGCGLKNLHYLGPLLPLTVALWLSHRSPLSPGEGRGEYEVSPLPPGEGQGVRAVCSYVWRTMAPVTTFGLVVSLWLCWPPQRPTFTLSRDVLGKNTLFRTNDYAEACHWARIRSPLYKRGYLGWQISQHTWVGYAARTAGAEVTLPLCVTDGDSPGAEYDLVFPLPGELPVRGEPAEGYSGAKLYCRAPELVKSLAAEHPLTGRKRFSWVFLPIAPEP